jgi:hypothetical protein
MFMCGKGNFKRLSAGSLATIAGTSLEEAKPQQRLPSQWVAATIAICLMGRWFGAFGLTFDSASLPEVGLPWY